MIFSSLRWRKDRIPGARYADPDITIDGMCVYVESGIYLVRLQKLGEDLTLAELFEEWPATIPVFIRWRMACVGCPMARFNTIKDAIRIYNLSSEAFLLELRGAITGKEGNEDFP